jgi:hypothetical protein
MSINHHLLAKTTTDKVLENFKLGLWQCCGNAGIDFYRVGCDNTFPSPDAAFYDDTNKLLVSFEFKPPTETKRGILTGLGQSLAYLNNSNLSYLIIPQKLDDFEIGQYMTNLYANQIPANLPIGLILYENNNPENVFLTHNVEPLEVEQRDFKSLANGRFWAKHQDLPIPLFHYLLHWYYQKKTLQISGDAFAYWWKKYAVPASVWNTLRPTVIKDLFGNDIRTVAATKNIEFYSDTLRNIRKLNGQARTDALEKAKDRAKTSYTGNGGYSSYRKNYVTFLKHIGAIDSVGDLTDEGFKLYHLGLTNGANSKLFKDYFTRTILLTGHHLDLIFDFDNLCNRFRGELSINEIKEMLLDEYEAKGMIKRNPKRVAGDSITVNFFRYEFILWKALDLFVEANGLPEISFNWKKITEICSLPEL